MKIATFSGPYPHDVTEKANKALTGCNIITIHPCFDRNNHYCLTVVYRDE